ncbi:MAG: hypothetical protein WDA09_05310 [Bacteriovoracaceae bacterium]
MKLKLLSFIFVSLLTTQAMAHVFTPLSKITTLPGRVTVEIINNNYRPIVCSGEIYGFKVLGQQILPFHNIIVPAGGVMPVSLFAAGMPFVSSNYVLGCHFIGW